MRDKEVNMEKIKNFLNKVEDIISFLGVVLFVAYIVVIAPYLIYKLYLVAGEDISGKNALNNLGKTFLIYLGYFVTMYYAIYGPSFWRIVFNIIRWFIGLEKRID